MQNYVIVTVPQDLLPQVVGELLQFTNDANLVDVVHGDVGRVIHVDPHVADAWMADRKMREAQATPAPQPTSEPTSEAPAAVPTPTVATEPAPITPVPATAAAPPATAASEQVTPPAARSLGAPKAVKK